MVITLAGRIMLRPQGTAAGCTAGTRAARARRCSLPLCRRPDLLGESRHLVVPGSHGAVGAAVAAGLVEQVLHHGGACTCQKASLQAPQPAIFQAWPGVDCMPGTPTSCLTHAMMVGSSL